MKRTFAALVTALVMSLAFLPGASATTSTITVMQHFSAPGGKAACLAAELTKMKAEYPQHQSGPSLSSMEALVIKKATPFCNGLYMESTLSKSVSAQCMGNCFYYVQHTVCDNKVTCYVAPIPTNFSADWSETMKIEFEARYQSWVEEDASRYPGTWSGYAAKSTAGYTISSWEAGSGPVWSFARAWGYPHGYVLVRDYFTVALFASWFPIQYHYWIWSDLYPSGAVRWGLN